jgi:hypothetical protein
MEITVREGRSINMSMVKEKRKMDGSIYVSTVVAEERRPGRLEHSDEV